MADLSAAVASMPFAAGLGITDVTGDADAVTATIDWDAARTTLGGAIHGGYLMAVADSVGAIAAFLHLPPGASTATIESSTNLLAAVTGGRCVVRSEPIHVGRTTIVVQTDITRDDGRLVSRTIQTQAVIAP